MTPHLLRRHQISLLIFKITMANGSNRGPLSFPLLFASLRFFGLLHPANANMQPEQVLARKDER